MVLVALWAAYLPFSRMFHFAAKYFFYHEILAGCTGTSRRSIE